MCSKKLNVINILYTKIACISNEFAQRERETRFVFMLSHLIAQNYVKHNTSQPFKVARYNLVKLELFL